MVELSQADNAILAQQSAQSKRLMFVGISAVALMLILGVIGLLLSANQTSQAEKVQHPPEAAALSTEELEILREQFKDALAAFESEIQPKLDDPELANWKPDEITAAAADKKLAVKEFAVANYATAIKKLEQAKETALNAEASWESDFNAEMASATAEFEAEKLNRAQLSLNNAAKIKPSSAEIEKLQYQIDVFPQIASLYQQHDVAVIENNLDKQIDALQAILQLDSANETVKQRLDENLYKRKDFKFQRIIQRGLARLEQGDFQGADKAYKQASQLFPNRAELNVLASKLDTTEFEFTLSTVHEHLSTYKASDDWPAVLDITRQAEPHFPSDALLLQYKEQAQTILTLQQKANDYVSRKARLADSNIKQRAKTLIRDSLPYLTLSPSLAAAVKNIDDAITLYSTLIPVTIMSDGKTTIEIVGEKTVGKVKSKIIELPVGKYTLEGSRKGYRNKLVSITVSNQYNNSIELVCNERI